LRRPTIRDLANAADVSIATVNRVLARGKASYGDVRLSFQATRLVVLLISDERFRRGFPLCHGAQAVEINLACRAL
jgi:DNA-binding MurR/RpiR family transcriptional regulator